MTLLALLFALPVATAQAPETSVSVQPNRIGASNRTTLRLLLSAPGPTSDIEWSTTLPVGVSPAAPPRLTTTCVGLVSLDGQTLTHSIDRMAGDCTTELDITANEVGEYLLTPGSVVSSAGGSEGVVTTLDVLSSLPSVALTAQPVIGPVGSVRSLQGTLVSSQNRTAFSVNVDLPHNMTFADGSVPSFECADNLFPAFPSSAVDGRRVSFSAFATPGSCVFDAEVVLNEFGSGEPMMTVLVDNPAQIAVTSVHAPARPASAGLLVGPPGAVVPLQLTLRNRDRSRDITALQTTVDLDALLPGLSATLLPPVGACGASSRVTGTTVLQIADVSIASGEDCVLPIDVQMPSGAVVGHYASASGPISLMVGDLPETWEPILMGASVTSDVTTDIALTPMPVGAGQPASLELTIDNGGEAISDYSVRLTVSQWLPGLSVDVDAVTACSEGATVQYVPDQTAPYLIVTVPTVPANDTCTVSVPATVPTDANHGVHVLASLPPTGTVDGDMRGFSRARATASVIGGPAFSASVADNRIPAGGSTTALFTASVPSERTQSLTDVAFDIIADDGVVLGTAEVSPSCGGGTLTSEPLGLSGGVVTPGQPCTVRVPVSVAADASPASFGVHSTGLTAVVDGTTVQSGPVSALVTVSAGDFNVAINTDRPLSEAEVVFTYTVNNAFGGVSPNNAYDINLAQLLPGATLLDGVVTDGCGGNATYAPTSDTFGAFTGLDIAEGATCTFETTVALPALQPGEYAYAAPPFTLNVGDATQVLSAPSVDFDVPAALLLRASMTPATLVPLATATVRYELTHGGMDSDTSIGFSHDLGGLPGLVATNTPLMDVCGPGSSVVGTTVLTVSGGQLSPQTSCTFDVMLQAPATGPFGPTIDLSTSEVSSMRNGQPVQTPGASLTLAFVPENCRAGFSNEEGLCVDIDECAEGTANCAELAVCTNSEGSFECVCADGYEGDGTVCGDTNECDLDPCADDADCTNTDGSFDCACSTGFDGDPFIACDPICGDGLVVDEPCDDGNVDAGDGCDSECVVEAGFACAGEPSVCAETCGDGVLDPLEECDDGDNNGADQDCLPDCTFAEPLDTDEPDPDGEGCSCASEQGGGPSTLLLLTFLVVGARRRPVN